MYNFHINKFILFLTIIFISGFFPRGAKAVAPDNYRWVQHATGLPATTSVCSLAIDPTDANIMYAYTLNKGVYKTTNGGTNWSAANTGLPLDKNSRWCTGNGEIAVDPNNNQIVYSVINGRIYKSVDSAANWTLSSTGTSVYSFDRTQTDDLLAGIIIDPNNSNILYTGTIASGYYGGVFKSTDAGNTWVQIEGSSPSGTKGGIGFNDAWPLAIDPSDSTKLYYSSVHEENVKSSDSGATWSKYYIPSVLRSCDGASIAIHPTNHTIFIGTNCGLAKSSDYGATWSENTTFSLKSINSITYSPSDPSILYALISNHDIYKSVDAGDTWELISSNASYSLNSIATHLTTPETIILGSGSQGLYKSTNSGSTLSVSNTGMTSAFSASRIYQSSVNPNIIYSYIGSKLYKSVDAGYVWTELVRGSVSPSLFNGVISVDPVSNVIYGTSILTSVTPWTSKMLRSTDDGASWTSVNDYSFNDGSYAYDIIFSPKNHEIALSYDGKGHLKKTIDGGLTWTSLPFFDGRDFGNKNAFAFDPNNSDIIYGGDRTHYPYKSIDGGQNWTQMTSGITDATVLSVAVSPYDSNLIIVGSASEDRLFRSTNGGATFSMVLDLHSYSDTGLDLVQWDISNSSLLYVSATNYLYKSANTGLTWSLMDTSLGLGCTKANFAKVNKAATGSVYARNGCDNQPFFYENYIPKFDQSTFTAVNHNGSSIYYPGDTVDFTFNLRNTGPATGSTPSVRFVIPSSISFVAGSAQIDGVQITPDPIAGSTITISSQNIAYSETASITFQGVIGDNVSGWLVVDPVVTSTEDITGTTIGDIIISVSLPPVFYSNPDHSCHDSPPTTIPDLFQINTTKSTSKIYFTPLADTNSYFISFSEKPHAEEHGAQVTLAREGVQNFSVNLLKPNTTYYFKVRGQNGCMPGRWSDVMKIKTNSKIHYKYNSAIKK